MSRTMTGGAATQAAKPTTSTASQPTTSTQACLPQEKVAMRAYQKWLQAGCKHGCDKQHWHEAESEIRAEMAKPGSTQTRR